MLSTSENIILIGYSGHAYVICDCILSSESKTIVGYCESSEKKHNPYELKYLGSESEEGGMRALKEANYFVAIGDNSMIVQRMPTKAIHSSAIISPNASVGNGTMIGPNAIINSMVRIGDGCICNSGSIVEHECTLGDYVHVGPGAVLCGNVTVGDGTLIGANALVMIGLKIGANVTIGAGAVVVNDVPDNKKVVGNPARPI